MMTREELIKKRAELAAEIAKRSAAYNERRAKDEAGFADQAEEDAWKKVNGDYDECVRSIQALDNDAEIAARAEQIRKDQEQSTRSGQKPGLDDKLPGEERTFGDAGFESRDQAAQYMARERTKTLLFRAWLIGGDPNLMTDEMRNAVTSARYNPAGNEAQIQLLSGERHKQLRASCQRLATLTPEERAASFASGELRALSKVTAGSGPELVPQTFVNQLEVAILAYGDMLAFVDTLTTETGETINWPIMNDTANEGAWVAEAVDTQVIGTPDPLFTRPTWGAHEMHSKWIKTPIALEEDSMFDLEMLLASALGERIGRTLNTAATTGTGTGQPTGIITDAAAGVTAASATAIAYDDLIKLEHSVDPNFRPTSRYMFHDNILQALRLLKDTTGMPLWQASMRDGAPDRLNGKPYVYNQAMASTIATTNKTVLFGDLAKYKLRRVRNVRIIRAAERFVEFLQVGYLGYLRADGRVLKPAAAARCPVKLLTQA